jgi:diketogulonate reductase-like aldo/keto reductase
MIDSVAARTKLNDGRELPLYGLGVWQASAKDTLFAVATALQEGYLLLDTAKLYANEARSAGRCARVDSRARLCG